MGWLARRGKITRRQYDAGVKFGEVCRSRHPDAAPAARKRLEECLAVLGDCHPAALVTASVDSACCDGVWPQAATAMGLYALCDGLNVLAELFGVPRGRKQGRCS